LFDVLGNLEFVSEIVARRGVVRHKGVEVEICHLVLFVVRGEKCRVEVSLADGWAMFQQLWVRLKDGGLLFWRDVWVVKTQSRLKLCDDPFLAVKARQESLNNFRGESGIGVIGTYSIDRCYLSGCVPNAEERKMSRHLGSTLQYIVVSRVKIV
jgi:hypothetical protein